MRGSDPAGGGLKSSMLCLCVKSWIPRVVADLSQTPAATSAPNLVFRRPMPTHGGRLPRRGSKQPPSPPRPHIDTLSARPNGAACRKVDPLTTRHVWSNLSAVEVPVDASRDQPLLLRHELKRLLSWSQRPFKCMNSLHFRRREYAGAWT